MGATSGSLQLELGPASEDFLPVDDVQLEDASQTEDSWLHTVDQRQHVDAKRRLEGSELVEVVEHLLWLRVPLQLDHDAHAVPVGFITQVVNAIQPADLHELGNLLDQRRLVDLVRQLSHDDGVPAPIRLLDEGVGSDNHPSSSGCERGLDALAAEDRRASREIRPVDEIHQIFDSCFRVVNQVNNGVADLAQVVRRDIRGHPDSDAGRAVDQQVGELRRQHDWLGCRAIVVWLKIDRVLVNISEQLLGDRAELRLGVAHRRRAIPIDRAEVALAID